MTVSSVQIASCLYGPMVVKMMTMMMVMVVVVVETVIMLMLMMAVTVKMMMTLVVVVVMMMIMWWISPEDQLTSSRNISDWAMSARFQVRASSSWFRRCLTPDVVSATGLVKFTFGYFDTNVRRKRKKLKKKQQQMMRRLKVFTLRKCFLHNHSLSESLHLKVGFLTFTSGWTTFVFNWPQQLIYGF